MGIFFFFFSSFDHLSFFFAAKDTTGEARGNSGVDKSACVCFAQTLALNIDWWKTAEAADEC